MTTPKVAVRLATDGKAQFKNDLEELRNEGNAAFADIEKSVDGANAAMKRSGETVQRVTAQLAAMPSQVNAATIDRALGVGSKGGSATSPAVTAALFRAQGQAADALKQRYDPLYAAQTRYNTAVAESQKALKAGLLTEAEQNAMVVAEGKALELASKAHVGHAGSVRLNAVQVNELTGAGRHMIDALISGQNPMRVLAQHAATLAQAAGSGEGGAAGALSAVTSGAGLAAVAVVALTAVVGVGAKAGFDYAKSNNNLALSLYGIGGATGLTARQLQDMAVTQSATAKIGIGAARDQEAAYLRMGVINTGVLSNLALVTKQYALVQGVDAKSATEALGRAFEHPSEGAKALGAQLGGLTSQTYLHIESLEHQNKVMEAQQALFDYLQGRLSGAQNQVTGLRKVVDDLTVSLSNMYAQLGKKVDFAINFRGGNASPDDVLDKFRQQQADGLGGQVWGDIKSLRAGPLGLAAHLYLNPQVSQADAAKAFVEKTFDMINTQSKASLDKSAALDLASQTDNDNAFPRQARLRQQEAALQAVVDRLKNPLESAEARARDLVTQKEDQNQVDRTRRHLDDPPKAPGAAHQQSIEDNIASIQANASATDALTAAYLKNSAAAERAEAVRKALTEGTRTAMSADQLDRAAQAEITLQIAKDTSERAKQVATLRDQTAAQASVNAAVRSGSVSYRDAGDALKLAEDRQALMNLIVAAGIKNADRQRQVLEALTHAQEDNNRAKAEAAALVDIGNADDEIRRLQLQASVLGQSSASQRVAVTAYDARRQAEAQRLSFPDAARLENAKTAVAGSQNALDLKTYQADTRRSQQLQIDTQNRLLALSTATDAVRQRETEKLRLIADLMQKGETYQQAINDQVVRNIDLIDEATRKQEAQRQAYEDIRQIGEDTLDRFNDLIRQGDTKWQDWANAAKSAIADVADEAFKLSVLNPAKNYLFGDNLPTAKTSGGIISAILNGFKPSAAQLRASQLSTVTYDDGGFTPRGFASGTDNAPAGWAWVGEDGPELKKLRAGDVIRPAAQSRRMATGGGDTHIHVHFNGDVHDPERVTRLVTQGVREAKAHTDKSVRTYNRNLPKRLGQVNKIGR